MKRELFTLIFVILFPVLVYSQILYSAKPIKAYFSFYKNGKSWHILNDSIKTSFFKWTKKKYSIKFYVNNEFKTKCKCYFSNVEKIDTFRYYYSDGIKTEMIPRKRTIRELVFKDSTCINFLPIDVLYNKE